MLRFPGHSCGFAFRKTIIACSTAVNCSDYASASSTVFTGRRFSGTVGSSGNHSGSRIYTSKAPSILKMVEGQNSVYTYMMKRWKSADPNKLACIQAETGDKLTFPEMLMTTERAAQVLYNIGGVRKGDVVCFSMLNTILYGPLCYGTMRLGALVSPVNPVAASATLAYHLKVNEAKVIITMKFFQKSVEEAVTLVKTETGRSVKVLYSDDFPKIKDKLDIPKDYNPIQESKADDTVFIPFSSGTSGMPKGVQLTNANLIANMEQARAIFHVEPKDVTVSVLPYFHIFGFTCCLNTALTALATQVVMMKYSAETFIDLIGKYKISVGLVAPPIVVSLIKSADLIKSRDVSSLKALRSGSAPLSADLEKMSEALFPGCSVGQGYGMTEMSPVVSAVPRDAGNDRTYGSSGKLVPDTEMRIVKVEDSQQSGSDASSGKDVEEGEDGEVWVRGPQLMKGYLKHKDSEAATQDGWFRTGDIGHYDVKTGDLLITDRLKELIKYKGFQVSPASIESILLKHPWIRDCVVIGIPDPRDVSFEMPRALVMLKPDLPYKDAVRASDEIFRYVMKHNPPHKRLHGGVRIVEIIPRNPAGKVMRRQIRQSEIEFVKAELSGEQPEQKS